MNFLAYFLLTIAAVLVVFAHNTNVNNTNNFESEIVRNTIYSVTQNYKQYEQHGGFNDAILVLKNGFIDCVNSLSISEREAMNAFSTGEELLLHNQHSSAIQAIQQGSKAALNTLYDTGVIVMQCLGDALALSNDGTREGLADASQMLQRYGIDVVNQIDVSANLASQAITAGGGTARQAIIAARQSLKAVYILLYEVVQNSHKRATKSISDAQNTPVHSQIENKNADAAERDPLVCAAIAEINKAAEYSISAGASAGSIIKLNQLLVSFLGDFAKIASEAGEYLDYVAKLANTDASLAEDIFRKEFEKSKHKLQITIAGVILSFSSAGPKAGSLSRKQLGVAIKAMEQGNVDVTSGNKIAADLTILGLGIPSNVRGSVLRAAVESARYGKLALFSKIIDAARIVFNLL